MGICVLKQTTPKARKDYRCDACDALLDDMVYPDDFDEDDIEILKVSEQSGWMINKGENYISQSNIYDGEFYTFRCRPEVISVYLKYNMNDV